MEDYYGSGKVIRAPSLKRGKIEERITDRIKLEKVLGVTVSNNAALSSDENGTIAYPAGCTVVLFNPITEQQHHIINTSRKTITSLAFSQCGRYLVTGECGHLPAIRVWDLYSDPTVQHPGLSPQPQQIAEFTGHKFGVNCVSFSPSGKYVVSVGTQHDMIVNVWDWRNNIKVASNKVSTKVKSVAFAENGSYFVTVGNRHVKFWYLEYGKSKYKEAVPLMGRSAILGEQRNNYFCDVACGRGECGDSTYAITRSGLLCEFNNRRLLDKWVELRTTSANCITIGEKYIFVGCAEGIIRCFEPSTLRFVTTLPRTHYLGVDVSQGTSIAHMASPPPDAKYPDTVALTYNESSHKLTSIYNDHSIYVWDVFNIKRVGKSHSFLYHSACIWGVEMAPPNSPLPPGTFLTCSSDDTIRVWTLDKLTEHTERGMYKQNIYSNELLKVVYVDNELNYLKDLDISVGGGQTATNGTTDQKQETSYDGRNGVRCIRISPDGLNLASGDRSGNIRIHDAATMKELCKIEAHDAEVLCLEYGGNSDGNLNLMASASRDRLLHVFDVNRGYEFLQTLDDHSSSITAVRFLQNVQMKHLQMVSCGADKSLIFRSLSNDNAKPQFQRDHNASGKTTLYDMEIDAGQKHVLTACQDRNVRIYSCTNGKHTKSLKGSTGDDGTLIKVVLDRSGIYLATSCTDKSLSVYDYYSGECMATMCGHSELATGLRFTNDCKHLISASGDGCVFVWRVPHDMVVTMHARLSQQALRQGKKLDSDLLNESSDGGNQATMMKMMDDYRQLPKWAKKQFSSDLLSSPISTIKPRVAPPKGRWAQRAENHPLEVHTFYSMEETSMKNVTMSRGDGSSEFEHDGDIDSDNEYRQHSMYYPKQADSPSGSEFTVTNIDADELRKSQRKKKLPQILIPQATSLYGGSQDSDVDDDEDEVSTPSGDNTDRNPMSLRSVSSESLDQLMTREKYLQSTFESMSGAESEHLLGTSIGIGNNSLNHSVGNVSNSSISSKFLARSSDINMAAINAVKQTKNDPEAMKKRQMLNKRIAETKKKLESVGHTSPLRYSQSIHDLSHIPEQDKWSSSSKKQQVYDENNDDELCNSNNSSNLRRSCSLSDLRMQKPVISKKVKVSGKKQSSIQKSRSSVATTTSTSSHRYTKNHDSLQRSKSTTILNQSDSENDTGGSSSNQEKRISRLMRQTISSNNKINKNNGGSSSGGNLLQTSRKRQSYSTNNINSISGAENVSTSDDEIETSKNMMPSTNNKPIVPPRTRNYGDGGPPAVKPRQHLNNKEKKLGKYSSADLDRTMTNDDEENTSEFSSIDVSHQICEDLIDELTSAADRVVKLYNRLNDSDEREMISGGEEKLKKLELSILHTQKVIHEALFHKLKQPNNASGASSSSYIDVNQTDTAKKLNDLVAKGMHGPNSVVEMMEQYSDILLDMIQQKMHNSNI